MLEMKVNNLTERQRMWKTEMEYGRLFILIYIKTVSQGYGILSKGESQRQVIK